MRPRQRSIRPALAAAAVLGCAPCLTAAALPEDPVPTVAPEMPDEPAGPGYPAEYPEPPPAAGPGTEAPPETQPDAPDAAVADPEIETPAAEPGAITTSQRAAMHDQMLRFMEEKRYAEAVRAARAVLRLTTEEFGEQSLRLAPPLDNLATAQMLNGELVDAARNYQRSIDIIRRHEGLLSVRLVNPYVGLGATYNRAEMYEQAQEAFEAALRLNHVNQGFYNLDQIKIHDGLTETYIGLDQFEDANFHQEIQLEINQRLHGEESLEVAPAMYKLARWYSRAGLVEEARYTYQRAQQIIKRIDGKESPALVPALEGLASTYERQGLVGESASRLRKALEIVESEEDLDHAKQGELLVRIGDLYGGTGRPDTANAYYERGWQALSQDSEDEELRTYYFGDPVRVAGLGWNALRYARGARRDEPGLRSGHVLLRYRVDTDGKARDVEIIESDPEDIMDKRVSSALRRSYFRPRYADGVAVTADAQLYRHEFLYEPSDEDRDASGSEPIENPDSGGTGGRIDRPEGG